MKLKALIILILFLFPLFIYAQYTWEEVALPDSIGIVDIAFNSDNEIFIATDHGPYYSQNGDQWEWLGIDDYPGTIYINGNNTIYIGSGDLYRSTDNGISWDTLRENPNGGGINSIYSQNDIYIYYGIWGGIYRSTDGGENWTEVLDLYNAEVINAIAENSQGKLFAGSISFQGDLSPGGIYNSTDGGATWQLTGLNYHFVSSIVINDEDEIFVGTNGHWFNGSGRIYKSTDSGQTWDIVFDNHYILSLSINEYNEIAAASETGIFCTYDDGVTWENITPSDTVVNFQKVAFHPENHLYAISYFAYADLYRTIEPVSVNNNYTVNSPNEITLYPNPSDNKIFLSYEDEDIQYNEIFITDLSGRIMRRIKPQYTNTIKIQIEDLLPAVYLIHCKSDHNISTVRFIKY